MVAFCRKEYWKTLNSRKTLFLLLFEHNWLIFLLIWLSVWWLLWNFQSFRAMPWELTQPENAYTKKYLNQFSMCRILFWYFTWLMYEEFPLMYQTRDHNDFSADRLNVSHVESLTSISYSFSYKCSLFPGELNFSFLLIFLFILTNNRYDHMYTVSKCVYMNWKL